MRHNPQLGNERGEWQVERRRFEKSVAENTTALADKQKLIHDNAVTIVDLNKRLQENQILADQLAAANAENTSLVEKVAQLGDTQDENERLKQELSRLQQDVAAKSALLETLPGASQLEAIQVQLASLQAQMGKDD